MPSRWGLYVTVDFVSINIPLLSELCEMKNLPNPKALERLNIYRKQCGQLLKAP